MVQELIKNTPSPIVFISVFKGVELWIKRDDLIHPHISGNKLYKLNYHVEEARRLGKKALLTFGGAYSNHLLATAAFAQTEELQSVGIIRGEQTFPLNPTLEHCSAYGMELHYVSRTQYANKTATDYLLHLSEKYPEAHIIPEGGGGIEGIRGAAEMIDERCAEFDAIICAMGTGTTLAGIAQSPFTQKAIGVIIHKHIGIMNELLEELEVKETAWSNKIDTIPHHCGGYAKWNEELLAFIQSFNNTYGFRLDPIYTGKAMQALMNALEEGRWSLGSKVLFIHTGGLQGVAGFEERFKRKLFER